MSLRLDFTASDRPEAQAACARLKSLYGSATSPDVVVALGGDGFLLQSVHRYLRDQIPIFGMNRGSVGFLLNDYAETNLMERILKSESTLISPLRMTAKTRDGRDHEALAFNEVSLLRQSNQAAHLEVQLNGEVKLTALVCDGIMVSTPAGSTAYNLSAHGPILPLDANVLALTPISPFRPRRWRGAILPHRTEVILRVLDPGKRPVSATADFHEVRDVRSVSIRQSGGQGVRLLFDPEHNLEQRILDEQFAAD